MTRLQNRAEEGAQSSIEAALKLIRREGIRSLYDGLSSSLIGIAVTNGSVSPPTPLESRA